MKVPRTPGGYFMDEAEGRGVPHHLQDWIPHPLPSAPGTRSPLPARPGPDPAWSWQPRRTGCSFSPWFCCLSQSLTSLSLGFHH